MTFSCTSIHWIYNTSVRFWNFSSLVTPGFWKLFQWDVPPANPSKQLFLHLQQKYHQWFRSKEFHRQEKTNWMKRLLPVYCPKKTAKKNQHSVPWPCTTTIQMITLRRAANDLIFPDRRLCVRKMMCNLFVPTVLLKVKWQIFLTMNRKCHRFIWNIAMDPCW